MPSRRRLDGALLGLAVLVLASAAARFALSRGVDAPWIAPDEQLYGLLGRSLVAGDGLRILGESAPYYSFLYPFLMGLPFVGTELPTGVTGVQALQALLMSATAVPVFLWTRRLAGTRFAFLAATLAILVPGLVYSGLLMSEALYYPAATLAVWALAVCLRRPSRTNQALLLGAFAVALATRLQAVGLVAALVVALALLAIGERSLAPFRRLLPTLSLVGIALLAWIATRLAAGDAGELAGAYAPVIEAHAYGLRDVARAIAWHAGAVSLLTILVPLVALGVLLWELLRGRESDPGVRALVATVTAYAAVTVVEVGAFASRFVDHVTERQLLSVAPPLFVVFAVWLARGVPRSQPVTAVVALLVAAPTLLLPLDRVATRAAAPDAPSTIPLEELGRHLSANGLEAVYAAGAALLVGLALATPRRAAALLPGIVAVALVATSLLASLEVRARSSETRAQEFAGQSRDWIDRAGVENVALLYTGERQWTSVWHQLFWNDSLTTLARLPEDAVPGAVPQTAVTPRFDGHLYAVDGGPFDRTYVVTPERMVVAGTLVATLPATREQPGLALWRADPPLHLRQWVRGLQPNGDLVDAVATIHVYSCGPGELRLTLLGKQGLPTRIRLNGRVVAERAIPPGEVWRASVPAPATATGEGRCDYELESEGLVGSTAVEFVPAASGAGPTPRRARRAP